MVNASATTPTTPSCAIDESMFIEKPYELLGRLNEAKIQFEDVIDYEFIIEAANGTTKVKQLAAQLIPKFFKHFPRLAQRAFDAHLDLCEAEDLEVRVHAIRGLSLFCKDTPEHVFNVVHVLAQLLIADDIAERDAVEEALMYLLRQDIKASLSALFKHVESGDDYVRKRVLVFVRDKIFPIKAELLKPPEQMERHIFELIKKSIRDVSDNEFLMFVDFLKILNLFGDKAPAEHFQELAELIESQA